MDHSDSSSSSDDDGVDEFPLETHYSDLSDTDTEDIGSDTDEENSTDTETSSDSAEVLEVSIEARKIPIEPKKIPDKNPQVYVNTINGTGNVTGKLLIDVIEIETDKNTTIFPDLSEVATDKPHPSSEDKELLLPTCKKCKKRLKSKYWDTGFCKPCKPKKSSKKSSKKVLRRSNSTLLRSNEKTYFPFILNSLVLNS